MSKTWIQQDGTPIKIKKMSLLHLKNTIAMLNRSYEKLRKEEKLKHERSIVDVSDYYPFPTFPDISDFFLPYNSIRTELRTRWKKQR